MNLGVLARGLMWPSNIFDGVPHSCSPYALLLPSLQTMTKLDNETHCLNGDMNILPKTMPFSVYDLYTKNQD